MLAYLLKYDVFKPGCQVWSFLPEQGFEKIGRFFLFGLHGIEDFLEILFGDTADIATREPRSQIIPRYAMEGVADVVDFLHVLLELLSRKFLDGLTEDFE